MPARDAVALELLATAMPAAPAARIAGPFGTTRRRRAAGSVLVHPQNSG